MNMPSIALVSAVARHHAVRPLLRPIAPFLRHLRRRLELRHFMKAYNAHWRSNRALVPRDHPKRQEYFDWGVTTLERAEPILRLIQGRRNDLEGVRFLDVGSGLGGSPITFARHGASEAVGIEIDRELLELSRALLRDLPCNARFVYGDALDSAFMASLGRFDVITCIDVIEHVDDPWRLIRHLAAALNPRGLLFLQIPNARSMEFVLKDPHYALFGISLLPHSQAKHYYEQLPFTDRYAVGEYYRLDEYREAFARENLTLEVTNDVDQSSMHIYDLATSVDELKEAAPARIDSLPVDAATRRALHEAISSYVKDFASAYATGDTKDVVLGYETTDWPVLAYPAAIVRR